MFVYTLQTIQITHSLSAPLHQASGGGLAAAAKTFLGTREAWCLDADVAAAESKKKSRERHRAGKWSRVVDIWGPSSPPPSPKREELHDGSGVTVDYVLQQIRRTNDRRRDRRSRVLRRRQRRRARWENNKMIDLPWFDDAQTPSDTDPRPCSDDSENDTAKDPNFDIETTQTSLPGSNVGLDKTRKQGARLALTASASLLYGLSLRASGETRGDDNLSTAAVTSRGCNEGSRDVSWTSSDQDKDNRDASVFWAVRRMGVPVVMVQSTEDALVGEPLPIFFQKKVCLTCFLLPRALLGRFSRAAKMDRTIANWRAVCVDFRLSKRHAGCSALRAQMHACPASEK